MRSPCRAAMAPTTSRGRPVPFGTKVRSAAGGPRCPMCDLLRQYRLGVRTVEAALIEHGYGREAGLPRVRSATVAALSRTRCPTAAPPDSRRCARRESPASPPPTWPETRAGWSFPASEYGRCGSSAAPCARPSHDWQAASPGRHATSRPPRRRRGPLRPQRESRHDRPECSPAQPTVAPPVAERHADAMRDRRSPTHPGRRETRSASSPTAAWCGLEGRCGCARGLLGAPRA